MLWRRPVRQEEEVRSDALAAAAQVLSVHELQGNA